MSNEIPVNKKYDPLSNSSTNNESIVTILYVDPVRHLAKIVSTKGRQQIVGIDAKIGTDGDGIGWLPPSGKEWKGVLKEDTGEPYIYRFLPPSTQLGDDNQKDKTTYSQGNTKSSFHTIANFSKSYSVFQVDQDTNRKNYRNNQYTDKVAGDFTITGLEGNMLGILRGGLNILKASELCQFQQFYEDDLTRLVSRNLQIFTDFGVKFEENKDGRTRMVMRGNSGRNPNTSTREETYEFEFQLGAVEAGQNTEDFFMTFEYKTPSKETVLIALGTDGNLVVKLPRDLWIDVKEDWLMTTTKNVGLFAGETFTLDATKDLNIEAMTKAHVNPDGTVTKTEEGFILKAFLEGLGPLAKKVAEIGLKDKQVIKFKDSEVLAGGDGSGTGNEKLVQEKHLSDHYNKLCQLIFDVFSAPALGDLGIPIPTGIRAQKLDSLLDLVLSLKDNTNKTKSLKGH